VTAVASHDGELSSAEILLWQGRFRRVFVALVGFGTVALKWEGVVSSNSVVAQRVGAHQALLWCAAMVVAYLALNEALMLWVRRGGAADHATIAAVIVADISLLFGVLYFATPPAEYPRALIVSIFIVQNTLIFVGARATYYCLASVALGYVIVVVGASDAGVLPSMAEHFWTLALFLLGSTLFVGVQGQISQRLKRIVHVFERAQEGDFSLQYDESLDQMPDAITVVGRAYNRMRGHLETIVLTDPLSGCFNRRGFDQLVTREVSRAVRGGQPLSVLAIDVDHFKKINDEYGHLTGDEVLREIGALLRETARLGDVVARIGGEEFEILAPDTGADGAKILAERIKVAFDTRPFTSVHGERKITVSIGIASEIARNDQVANVLIARADEALYVAKRNGRDRAELWQSGLRASDGSAPGRRSMVLPSVPDRA
jgi:diguanylate cyclase (GGDEF)-like protein